jgi:hypothetical protein
MCILLSRTLPFAPVAQGGASSQNYNKVPALRQAQTSLGRLHRNVRTLHFSNPRIGHSRRPAPDPCAGGREHPDRSCRNRPFQRHARKIAPLPRNRGPPSTVVPLNVANKLCCVHKIARWVGLLFTVVASSAGRATSPPLRHPRPTPEPGHLNDSECWEPIRIPMYHTCHALPDRKLLFSRAATRRAVHQSAPLRCVPYLLQCMAGYCVHCGGHTSCLSPITWRIAHAATTAATSLLPRHAEASGRWGRATQYLPPTLQELLAQKGAHLCNQSKPRI